MCFTLFIGEDGTTEQVCFTLFHPILSVPYMNPAKHKKKFSKRSCDMDCGIGMLMCRSGTAGNTTPQLLVPQKYVDERHLHADERGERAMREKR